MSGKYTSEQVAAVERVLKLKSTDYYGILQVKRTCTSIEVKKAYRKMALVMHPDKNFAPKADEAFKRISDAFQVLSDEQQRRIYDQTGADPRSRAQPTGFGRQGFGAAPPFAQAGPDIFSQFFSGTTMGGPGFQFHFAGDPNDIFAQMFGGVPRGRAHQQRTADATQGGQEKQHQTYIQLILIAAIFILPTILSWVFGGASSSLPQFTFEKKRPYTEQRFTPKYNVPFYVNPKDVRELSDAKLRTLSKQAENQFVSNTRSACTSEYLYRQQMMENAMGWFFTDEAAYEEAKNMPLPHCDTLDSLGIKLQKFI